MVKILFFGGAHQKIKKNLIKGFRLAGIECIASNNPADIAKCDIIYSPSTRLPINKFPNKKFILGPQFSVFPNNNSKYNCKFNNAIYIQPSEWCKKVWTDEFNYNSLPVLAYPVGVDTDDFAPSDYIKEKVFIYYKRRKPAELQYVKSVLDNKNIPYVVFTYGSYTEKDYKQYLDSAKFGIWLGAHESEGFALLEALSMNVPLLVWNISKMSQEEGSNYNHIKTEATTIPYWDDRCGDYFYSKDEFVDTLNLFMDNINKYTPRQFILDNLKLKIQTQKFLDLI